MIEIGSFCSGVCQGISRRAFVRASFAAVLGGSSITRSLAALEAGGSEYGHARAKSVILLWLWGGPSHIDTFDPKPDAPSQFRGPFSTIPTRVPGIRFTELFPRLARRNDRFTLVRSHRNHDGGHLGAGSIGLTGTRQVAGVYGPNFGSITARARRSELPSFISVGRRRLRDAGGFMKGDGGGTWGKAYDPFPVSCSDEGKVDIPGLKLLDGLTPSRLEERRRLLKEIDRLERDGEGGQFERWNATTQRAYSLLASDEGRRAFDLSRESSGVRDAYGHTAFGQSALLARRLAEVGVPYIQVNWSEYVEPFLGASTDYGWDTHTNNFELLNDRHGPILDRVLSALLDDLRDRGMLDSTLVVCLGEFGRTPRINGNMARDHHPGCYSSIWAGAGVPGGKVIGESDATAHAPITDAIHPDAVGATILELAGITAEKRAEFRVLQNAGVIHGLV